jgi:hypothetical protein
MMGFLFRCAPKATLRRDWDHLLPLLLACDVGSCVRPYSPFNQNPDSPFNLILSHRAEDEDEYRLPAWPFALEPGERPYSHFNQDPASPFNQILSRRANYRTQHRYRLPAWSHFATPSEVYVEAEKIFHRARASHLDQIRCQNVVVCKHFPATIVNIIADFRDMLDNVPPSLFLSLRMCGVARETERARERQ